jgi:hypothetical protein
MRYVDAKDIWAAITANTKWWEMTMNGSGPKCHPACAQTFSGYLQQAAATKYIGKV